MKTRNKKRLISLVLVFALVFLTGAAFAFTNGILDIVGTVNISAPDDVYIRWANVEHADPLLTLHATQNATIVNRDGPGDLERTGQRILWTITFNGDEAVSDPGFAGASAQISATAENLSNQIVDISAARVRWIDAAVTIEDDELVYAGANVFDPADYGLTVTVTPGTFVGPLAAHTTSTPLVVTVNWDGETLPDYFFNVGREDDGDALDAGAIVLVGYLVIEFDYAPVA